VTKTSPHRLSWGDRGMGTLLVVGLGGRSHAVWLALQFLVTDLHGLPSVVFQLHYCISVSVVIATLIPRPPRPAFVTCSTKSGEKAWTDLSRDVCCCWRHVQSAHTWVYSLPFNPWIQFVLSVQFVLQVRLLLDR